MATSRVPKRKMTDVCIYPARFKFRESDYKFVKEVEKKVSPRKTLPYSVNSARVEN
jgi:hypothetical protein